jgi:hypothetical protein
MRVWRIFLTPIRCKKPKNWKLKPCKTSYIENLGKGKFHVKPLPVEAQFSMACALLSDDFDKDGHTDILLSGNFYPFRVQYGRVDASVGLLLRGNGKGEFILFPGSKAASTPLVMFATWYL